MTTIIEAIASRNQRIHELKTEIAQLEKAARLVGGLLEESAPVKPPPPVRRAKPVRAEPKPKAAPSKAAEATFGCGHPRTDENSDIGSYVKKNGEKSRNCRACRIATQKRARDRKAKAEPDAVQAHAKTFGLAKVPEPKLTVALAPIAEPKAVPHIEAVKKWAAQCPMLDSETGKRCSLEARHDGLHSASGRLFSNAAAINVAEMGGSVRA